MAELRPNRVKHKLEMGGVAAVVQGELTPDLVELCGPLGFDGIWIEAEHGPIDFGDMRDLTRACDLWGLTSVARVHANEPGLVYRTLDQGVQTIVMPHVNTAEEARAVVDAAKFHPIGSRGSYTGRQGIGVEDYYAKANDEVMVGVLIEDIVAIENLDEILKVDHIDVYFVVTGDLSQTMGHPGQPAHPDVVAARDKAFASIVAAGKVAGTVTTTANVESFLSKGVRLITTPFRFWLAEGAEAYLEAVARATR